MRNEARCMNPNATKEQIEEWNRMVQDLEHRKQEEQNERKRIDWKNGNKNSTY